jgi:hypothetical protein
VTAKQYPARMRARIESREAALRQLGYRDYNQYLRSPEWQSVRIRHTTEFGESCGLCDTREGVHQLHHLTYDRVGRELLSDLVRLCGKCHQMVHALERRGEIGLDFSGLADLERATRYARESEHRNSRMNALPSVDRARPKRPGRRERMKKRARAHQT